jgi:hypothetical protein
MARHATGWHGSTWHGTARHGLARQHMARHGTARSGTARTLARHVPARHGTARSGTARAYPPDLFLFWHGTSVSAGFVPLAVSALFLHKDFGTEGCHGKVLVQIANGSVRIAHGSFQSF